MYEDLIRVIIASRDPFIKHLMQSSVDSKKQSLSKPTFFYKPFSCVKTLIVTGEKFRNDLQNLMVKINTTQPHYIRCVKPNHDRKPASVLFDAPMVLQQLTYAGVFEAVNIRRKGFPFRLTHEKFFKRFAFFFTTALPPPPVHQCTLSPFYIRASILTRLYVSLKANHPERVQAKVD